MAKTDTPLTFTVRRHAPELIVPAMPTPRELKPLSDIDDQEILRSQVHGIQIYRGDQKMKNKNPASVIKEALAKLLVFYYPFAGRLKEGLLGKLMVDCSGEGVLFIEAEADVTLDQFGDALHPPFACVEELLYDVPGSGGILDSPLLLIQVTQLLCGSFIFGVRFNHTMCDAVGLAQFMSGLGEIARGATSPLTLPVWERELLCSSDQPSTISTHHEYDQVAADTKDDIAHKSLFFTSTEILALRKLVPIHLQSCSTFEVLTACLWRCYTIALQPNPKEDMHVMWPVNVRNKFNPPLPVGYYGNVMATASAVSTARDLCNNQLGYALQLVMKVKTKDYNGYVSDLIKPIEGQLSVRPYIVSDLTRAGLDAVDMFGWGKPAYAGPATGRVDNNPGLGSFYIPYTNNKGESGIVVPVSLPSEVMDRFVKELNKMLVQ